MAIERLLVRKSQTFFSHVRFFIGIAIRGEEANSFQLQRRLFLDANLCKLFY